VAITTSLATRYWLKTIIMAIVCVVLGFWGVYDYVVVIPDAIQDATRADLQNNYVKDALYVEMGAEERDKAAVALHVALEEDAGLDPQWKNTLLLFKSAVESSDGATLREAQDVLNENLNAYGSVVPPSKFDRPMQWLFILCIPFGFYYFWAYFKMKKKANTYRLEDSGTLVTPEGTWSSEEIEDIDMERWISKTGKARTTWTAKVVVSDHAPVLLDDYIYEDMHLIIGKLAHRFYPKEWTPLAKRIKVEIETEEGGEEE
jgi:hypothetical protein